MKLNIKFNLGTFIIFALLATGVSWITLNLVNNTIIKHVTNSVRVNIKAGWLIYENKLAEIRSIGEVLAEDVHFEEDSLTPLTERLTLFKKKYNLDVLDLIDAKGNVYIRTSYPYHRGDSLLEDPLVKKALYTGEVASGTTLLKEDRLKIEGEALVEDCLKYGGEPTGMLVGSAIPVISGGKTVGVLLAGVLLNGATEMVDRIRDSVFENEWYKGKPLGTATIFMGDLRISTNVMKDTVERAIGTRVSQEVIDQVLTKGISWTGRAWVVDAWYISQYDPIRDPNGNVIGMLYLGELEQKYNDIRLAALRRYLLIVLLGMTVTFFVIVLKVHKIIVEPIEQLSYAMKKLADGELGYRVNIKTDDEVGILSNSLNRMAEKLERQRSDIEDKQKKVESAHEEVKAINRNYMEMLGFVSHELKNPLASAVMSLYTVKDGYLGDMNAAQKKSLDQVARSLDYFHEMIKNYLDLSRLEKGEIAPNLQKVYILAEVINVIVEGLEREIQSKGIKIKNKVSENLSLIVDRDLLRVVFDNLIANAVKYGRSEGVIEIGSEERQDDVVFYVFNDGDGIPRDKIPLLFKKFSRVNGRSSHAKKGTGLGLFISNEIVKKHGGEMYVDSEEGKWVKFSFTIKKTGEDSV